MPTAERHRNISYHSSAAALVVAICLGAGAAQASAGEPVRSAPALERVAAPLRGGRPAGESPDATTTVPSGPAPGRARVQAYSGRPDRTAAQAVTAGDVWALGGLQASTVLVVPMALGGLVAVFMVVQWLIDRRDPRLVDAPSLQDEDSVGFE